MEINKSELIGGVKYSININSDTDIQVGQCSSAQIQFTTTSSAYTIGTNISYIVRFQGESTSKLVGNFLVTDIIKKNSKNYYDITAYDYMTCFDKDVYAWLHAQTFPITVYNLYVGLCQQVNVDYDTSIISSSGNFGFQIGADFSTNGITGRTVLSYLAQILGKVAYITPTGIATFKTYGTTPSINVTNSMYTSIDESNFISAQIDKVHQALYDGDTVGYDAGTGNNVLNIIGNSAFYNTTSIVMQNAVNNIYDIVHAIPAYIPTTVNLLKDYNIGVGDCIKIGNNSTPTLVMSKTWDGSGVTLSSTGRNQRDNTSATSGSAEIQILNGKYNRLSRDLDTTRSEVGQIGGSVSVIEQQLDNITLSVTPAVGESGSQIKMSLDGIEAASANITLSGNVVFKSNLANQGETNINGGNITTGTISADRLNLTNSITFNDFTSETQAAIRASSAIRQTDPPTHGPGGASDPLTNGQLWYCTGTPTGSYSAWATNTAYTTNQVVYVITDATNYYICNLAHTSTGNTIDKDVDANGKSYWLIIQSGNWYSYNGTTWVQTNNPNYIQATYIDSTTIKSPTLEGNTVIVNTDQGGAFVLKKAGETKGFMGYGHYISGGNNAVVVTNDVYGDGAIDPDEDYYLAITDGVDARVQAGDCYIKITPNGCVVNNGSGEFPLYGAAVFT